jgi:hypothetical protein
MVRIVLSCSTGELFAGDRTVSDQRRSPSSARIS